MKTQIRDIEFSDAQAVAEVHVLAWKIAYRGILDDSILDALSVQARKERWEKNIKNSGPRVRTIVGVCEGKVLGFLSYGEDRARPGAGELWAIYVHPDVWGKGIGRKMWAFVEGERARYEGSVVWVFKENTRAIRFYQSLGYKLDGQEKDFVHDGRSFPEVRLTLNQ